MTAATLPTTTLSVLRANGGKPAEASAWRMSNRPGSGQYVVSLGGSLLFRLDRANGVIFAWDKQLRSEVPVRLADLVKLCSAAPNG